MPKNRKLEDSSDSDSSGPKDRNPPKKSKTDSGSSSSKSGSSKPKDGDTREWQLDKRRTVKINEFRGRCLVDIREYYEDKDGELKPGKKGISLSAEQFRKFKEIIPEIEEALKNA